MLGSALQVALEQLVDDSSDEAVLVNESSDEVCEIPKATRQIPSFDSDKDLALLEEALKVEAERDEVRTAASTGLTHDASVPACFSDARCRLDFCFGCTF